MSKNKIEKDFARAQSDVFKIASLVKVTVSPYKSLHLRRTSLIKLIFHLA